MVPQNRVWLIYLLLAPLALVRRFRKRRPGWIEAGARR